MISGDQIIAFQEQLKMLSINCNTVVSRKFLESTNGNVLTAVEKYFDNPNLYDAMSDKEGAKDPLLNPYKVEEEKKSGEVHQQLEDKLDDLPVPTFEPNII